MILFPIILSIRVKFNLIFRTTENGDKIERLKKKDKNKEFKMSH